MSSGRLLWVSGPLHIPSSPVLLFPQPSVGFCSAFNENLLHKKNISLSSLVPPIVFSKSLVCNKGKLCVLWMNLIVPLYPCLPSTLHIKYEFCVSEESYSALLPCPSSSACNVSALHEYPWEKCWWMNEDLFCNWGSSLFKFSCQPICGH